MRASTITEIGRKPRLITIKPSMPNVFYLAYGSNLHPVRLNERVPSALAIGVVELPGYSLAFHKRSDDDSGKCLLYIAQRDSDKTYGVLYEFDASQKPALDDAEGKGKGYFEQQVSVPLNGQNYTAFFYMASSTQIDPARVPYHWYKNLVLAGAHFHDLPPDYIASIKSVPSKEDFNKQRKELNEALLRRMGWV